MTVVRLTDLERIDVSGLHWRPLRAKLGVTAFKTNAYTADAGERLIEEHTEGGSNQEEMYVLVAGAATFTRGDETVDVEAGTVVFYGDPHMLRGAIATQDGTVALAVGNVVGAAGPPSTWEWRMRAGAMAEAGDPAGAYDHAAEILPERPDDGGLHYDLACFAALAGRREQALEHWRRAVELRPEVREWAGDDSDLDSIRDALQG
jgi:tetratricopeptide (TPR) repeat protein